MPADDYSAAVTGGLKLKGVNSASKISKNKKKKKAKLGSPPTEPDRRKDEILKLSEDTHESEGPTERANSKETPERDPSNPNYETPPPPSQRTHKTEAELRHEERRRKRLDERFKREGTRTHKERVEELNRYLSNLSEHHDMPRIGPG